jgi:hypothetical protein
MSIDYNEYIYLVGRRDEEGFFHCWGEFSDEHKALASYKLTCYDYPTEHIELIRQFRVHEILEKYMPLDNLDELL